MKRFFSSIAVFLFLIPFSMLAQKVEEPCQQCCCTKHVTPAVAKGYYSIGNNQQRLTTSKYCVCCLQSNGTPISNKSVNKGYYAIGNNHKKLQKAHGKAAVSPAKNHATKGYYSIGKNNQKLAAAYKYSSCCCH